MSATKCIAALGSRSTIAGWVAISLSPESTVALDRECVAVSNIQQRWDLTAGPENAICEGCLGTALVLNPNITFAVPEPGSAWIGGAGIALLLLAFPRFRNSWE